MKNYSKLGLFKSKGRLNYEPQNHYRTPFQRDRDRIIHSASFRRLKHKTQVFVNTEGDHYRTRITHSIEVAQIARTIAKYLNLNDDLAETLSLAHDLGHTPFGHAGEDALNECMLNYGGFDHNLQTLRIVMFLENKYVKFNGLNLTIETLDGLLKHNGPLNDTKKLQNIIGIKNLKNKIKLDKYSILTFLILLILLTEWFYNHPALRYGGYILVFLIFCIPFSIFLEKYLVSNNSEILKKKVIIIFILVLTIFLTRNVNRIIKENSIYEKLSLYSVNYLMDESYFRIDKQFKSLEKNYFECKNTGIKCKSPIKKEFGIYIFPYK